MDNFYYYLIIWITVFFFILEKGIDYLNTLNWSSKIPEELKEIYSEEKYKKSQDYERVKHSFSNYSDFFTFIITILVLVFWWFWYLDSIIREYTTNPIYMALLFFGFIQLIQTIISIPFSYYSTFVIEEKFGFNKMTKKLFFIDLVKWFLLSSIIWWLIISLIVWIYSILWSNFWIYAWFIMTFISIFFMMFYSSLIVPIFNKQTPLEDWDLRKAIEKFSKKVWFELDNIYVIDWSKRSTKANAYFSWLWSKKRIVLYDTLINDLTIDELVAVLAHEIGHYKKKHTYQMLIFSIIQTWFMLYLFSLSLLSLDLAKALWANNISFHIWTIAFWILFTPISMILWLFWNILSRKNEYEADYFAWKNIDPELLISALKKLSINNLSNLKPHPIYEFFHYSHPTVLKRFTALRNIKKD